MVVGVRVGRSRPWGVRSAHGRSIGTRAVRPIRCHGAGTRRHVCCQVRRRTSDVSSTLEPWRRSSSSSAVASAERRAGAGSGAVPGCSAFGTLVEELHGRDGRACVGGTARLPERLGDVRVEEAARISTGVPELDRVLGGGLVPPRSSSSAASPASASRHCSCTALGAIARSGRTALLVTGEESSRRSRLRAERLGGADDVAILAETELEAVCATLERDAPAVCVIDSVQTLYAERARLRSRLGSAGARGRGAPAACREAERRRDDPRRARHEGRIGGRPARARAPRRLRPPVRGRPLPRAPHPPRDQEPLRLDERARRVRDDRRRPRRRPRSVGAVRLDPGRRGRSRRRCRPGGDAADPARDPGARLPHRPRDAAEGRHGCRPEAARDDRRGSRPSRRRPTRLGGRVRQRRGRRARSTSPAPTWPLRSRSLRPRAARRRRTDSRPSASSASPGACERPPRRNAACEECAKLGVTLVVAPYGTRSGRGGPRVVGARDAS